MAAPQYAEEDFEFIPTPKAPTPVPAENFGVRTTDVRFGRVSAAIDSSRIAGIVLEY